MAPKDMPADVVDVGNKHVSNKDVMPDAGKVKLGKYSPPWLIVDRRPSTVEAIF